MCSARRARKQEVRDIGTRNEPQDAHGAHQDPQRHPDIAGEPVLQRNQDHRLHAILGILARKIVTNSSHPGLGAREGDTRFELPSDVVDVIRAPCLELRRRHVRRWLSGEGKPEVRSAGITKSGCRYSDDHRGTILAPERFPDRGLSAAEVCHCP